MRRNKQTNYFTKLTQPNLLLPFSAPVSDKLAENTKLRVYETIVNEYSLWMNLSIKSLAPKDFGVYVCASVNALGKTENQVSLHSK